MTMAKGVSLSIFLAACLALYLAVLMLINPTLPGATSVGDSRIAYGVVILTLAFVCCIVAGLTWSHASTMRPGVAVSAALSLWSVLLVVLCITLGVAYQLPL